MIFSPAWAEIRVGIFNAAPVFHENSTLAADNWLIQSTPACRRRSRTALVRLLNNITFILDLRLMPHKNMVMSKKSEKKKNLNKVASNAFWLIFLNKTLERRTLKTGISFTFSDWTYQFWIQTLKVVKKMPENYTNVKLLCFPNVVCIFLFF